jgi:hypothetical protein
MSGCNVSKFNYAPLQADIVLLQADREILQPYIAPLQGDIVPSQPYYDELQPYNDSLQACLLPIANCQLLILPSPPASVLVYDVIY